MSCPKCGKTHRSTGAICGGVGQRFQARVRWPRYRRWTLVGKPTKSYRVAVRRMATAFSDSSYMRADVIMWADYYEPVQLCELVRR